MADWICRAKKCLILAVTLLLLLTGCAGRPLIEREIVRAVFFTREDGKEHAVLLLQNQESEDSSDYEVASGEGESAAQALADAAAELDGVMFYGLTDLVALPADCDWEQLQEFASLLYETAQPSPEITLFLLDSRTLDSLEQTAGDLYDEMQAVEKKYRISCGLESVLSQADQAALPCWQGTGYGFAVLKAGEQPLRYVEPVRAQLAAVLCGQSRQLEFVFAGNGISCKAGATILFHAMRDRTQVILRLQDTSLSALTREIPNDEETLRHLLSAELEDAFAQLCADTREIGADPFRLTFWQECLQGTQGRDLPAVLTVEYA